MIVYHTTKIENEESIKGSGIEPAYSEKLTEANETLQDKEGVYFFTNIEDAETFGEDQNDEYIIFSAEINEHIVDPEYDGEAVFVETGEAIETIELVRRFEY